MGVSFALSCGWGLGGGDVLLGEHALEEPGGDGEVAAFVVGGEEDGVFVLGRHGVGIGGFVSQRLGWGGVW